MNTWLSRFPALLHARFPQWLLMGQLLALHVLVFGGWQTMAGRLLWPVVIGLMLIWQPFVAGERRVGWGQALSLVVLGLGSIFFLNPWLLLLWCGVLAAVIGGRVLWTVRQRERFGYLLAFAYVLCLVILGAVPALAPNSVVLDPLPTGGIAQALLWCLPALLLFPAKQPQRRAGDAFDLLYGAVVFLMLAVLVMGSLAYMQIARVGYVEAVFKSSLFLAGALLILAWAWNPRSGFSGVGSAVARYVLSVGMPLEQWLQALEEESDRHKVPEEFMPAALGRLRDLPWVAGGEWEDGTMRGGFGGKGVSFHRFTREGLSVVLYFSHAPSPAMRWHFEWLLRLLAEYYLVKCQAAQLQRMGYLQAVYETGSRVTHDVKNLLQSLQTLCFAATHSPDPVATRDLLARQLPMIVDRLKSTVDKLQQPAVEGDALQSSAVWWEALQGRYAICGVEWVLEGGPCLIPQGLFDSVTENLLQNALVKRQLNPGLSIRVRFSCRNGVRLEVEDNGPAIPKALAGRLLREPVASENGLGIGLYHAARQAETIGYRLLLARNQDGAVCFSLSGLAQTR